MTSACGVYRTHNKSTPLDHNAGRRTHNYSPERRGEERREMGEVKMT
jgi:hypothetical protein